MAILLNWETAVENGLQKVAIDADFYRHTTEHEMGTGLFEKILSEYSYYPVMHKYIAEIELKYDERLPRLIKENKIEIISERDYLEKEDIEDYEEYFHYMYERINQLPLGDENVITYGYDGQKARESLGEIRSGYMAWKLGYGILVSDDRHAKIIVNSLSSAIHPLVRKSLYDLLIDNHRNNGSITWKDIRVSIPRAFDRDEKRRNELINLYKPAETKIHCAPS